MSNRIGDYDKYKYPRLCCKSNEGSNNYASYYRVSRKGHYWKLEKWCRKHDYVYWTRISFNEKELWRDRLVHPFEIKSYPQKLSTGL